MVDLITIALAIASPLAVLIVGGANIRTLREQIRNNKKQHQVQGLLEAFKILDSPKHREFRKRVIVLYFEYHEHGLVGIFRNEEAVANVRADFDILGKLVESENIDRNDFLEEFGSLAYWCWRCLEDHIMDERKRRKFDPFMTWFEWLGKQGYKYWDERKPRRDLDDTVLSHPNYPDQTIDLRSKPKRKGSPI
jgi:hypothetical protein